MIKLQSTVIELFRADGSVELLNTDVLRAELAECCHETGYDDPDLADDLIRVVQQYASTCRSEKTTISRQQIDTLLARMLCDTGLESIARAYRNKHQAQNDGVGATAIATDLDGIRKVLRTNPHFIAHAIDALAEDVHRAVTQLGLELVTTTLLIELAKGLAQKSTAENQTADDGVRYWAVSAGDVRQLSADLDEFIESGALSIRPVSMLFPEVCLSINLGSLSEQAGITTFTELAYYPVFELLCQRLERVVTALKAMTKKHLPHLQPDDLCVSVNFGQLSGHAVGNFCLPPASVRRLQTDLSAIMTFHLGRVDCRCH